MDAFNCYKQNESWPRLIWPILYSSSILLQWKTYVNVTVEFPTCTAADASSGFRLGHAHYCSRFHVDCRCADRKSAKRSTSGDVKARKPGVYWFDASKVVPWSSASAAASLEGCQHTVRSSREGGVGTVLVMRWSLMMDDVEMICVVEVVVVIVWAIVTSNSCSCSGTVEQGLMRQRHSDCTPLLPVINIHSLWLYYLR